MCDIIWCKKEIDGKVCNTVNYLDPFNFWNWEGKIACAECGTVYYIYMIEGWMYKGPEEQPPGTEPDILPLYADKPLEGYTNYLPGIEGRTRPYLCLPRHIYLGQPDPVKFSLRGYPVRGQRPQPPSLGPLGSAGFKWEIEKLSPELWEEFLDRKKRGLVRDW